MYKNKQAVTEIIIIEKILFLEVGFFNLLIDFIKPMTDNTTAITDKQPINVETI